MKKRLENFSPTIVFTASFISSWLIFPSPSRSNFPSSICNFLVSSKVSITNLVYIHFLLP
ncbi:hypothetical protein INR49_027922 [Caranx melampygus]|nr:hypothetical protein INR49_027922 [Caranx melampygus]